MIRASIMTLGLLLSSTAWAQTPNQPPPVALSVPFLAAHVGVDTHVQYTDGYGMYASPTAIESGLNYLGVSLIRDGLPSNSATSFPAYQGTVTLGALSAAGIRFDLILADYTQGIAYDQAALDRLFTGSPNGNPVAPAIRSNAIIALEGLNEINNQSPQPSMAQANAWQQKILCLTRSESWCTNAPDPHVAGVSVATYTGNASQIAATATPSPNFPADILNVHPYAAPSNRYGESLYQIEQDAVSESFGETLQPWGSVAGVAPAPIQAAFTESGAYVEPVQPGRNDLGYLNGYDAHTMAIKDLDTLLDGVQFGAVTYLYQLFDNYSYDSDNQYGLFTYGGSGPNNVPILTPTPAAVGIHNLLWLTKAYTRAPVSTDCLRHSFSGLPTGARSMTLHVDDTGDYAILLWWDNPNDWNKDLHQEVAVTPAAVTLSLVYPANALITDVMPGGNPAQEFHNARAIPIQLGDDPLLIALHGYNLHDLACTAS